jgi:hypothetical protein
MLFREAECVSLLDFLMESEGARSVRRSLGSELLAPEAVAELLHEVDKFHKLQHSQPVKMRVKAQMLFKVINKRVYYKEFTKTRLCEDSV